MINEHNSPEQIKRIRNEGYTADNMRKYLFHLKENGWIKEFQWQKQKNGPYRIFLFRLRHTSELYSIWEQFNLQYERKSKIANEKSQKTLQEKCKEI